VAGPEEIARAAAAVARGQVVGYPTETFYGLGADALDEAAVARLLALKGRGAEKTLSALVLGEAMLALLVAEVSPAARALMAAHWPGPLTLALPARPGLPAALVSDGFVAVRESPHPDARALLAALGRPLTATSANPAGAPPPTTAQDVSRYFQGLMVIDGGATPGGRASTVVRVRGETLEVVREGAVVVGGGGVA
jgi:L-threonylcarbamoyladenylate synthase